MRLPAASVVPTKNALPRSAASMPAKAEHVRRREIASLTRAASAVREREYSVIPLWKLMVYDYCLRFEITVSLILPCFVQYIDFLIVDADAA
jgi:hypothetical protein